MIDPWQATFRVVYFGAFGQVCEAVCLCARIHTPLVNWGLHTNGPIHLLGPEMGPVVHADWVHLDTGNMCEGRKVAYSSNSYRTNGYSVYIYLFIII